MLKIIAVSRSYLLHTKNAYTAWKLVCANNDSNAKYDSTWWAVFATVRGTQDCRHLYVGQPHIPHMFTSCMM